MRIVNTTDCPDRLSSTTDTSKSAVGLPRTKKSITLLILATFSRPAEPPRFQDSSATKSYQNCSWPSTDQKVNYFAHTGHFLPSCGTSQIARFEWHEIEAEVQLRSHGLKSQLLCSYWPVSFVRRNLPDFKIPAELLAGLFPHDIPSSDCRSFPAKTSYVGSSQRKLPT
jgi:hypothetical protein